MEIIPGVMPRALYECHGNRKLLPGHVTKYILMLIYLVTVSAGELILGWSNVSHISCHSSSRHRLPVCVFYLNFSISCCDILRQRERDKEG